MKKKKAAVNLSRQRFRIHREDLTGYPDCELHELLHFLGEVKRLNSLACIGGRGELLRDFEEAMFVNCSDLVLACNLMSVKIDSELVMRRFPALRES